MKKIPPFLFSFFFTFFGLQNSIHAFDAIGFGVPCVDMVYAIDENLLQSMSVHKGDGQRASWETFSFVLDTCTTNNFSPIIVTGGTASNTTKGLANLGNETAFVGKIGQDDKGDFYRKTIEKLGIISLLIPSDIPTTQIGVFVTPDQQRTFLSFAGAGHSITPHDFNSDSFKGARLVHIDGYMLEDIPCVEKAMQYAKAQGSLISLDMGCLRIVKKYSTEILRLLSTYADVAFANEDEIEALVGLSALEGCAAFAQYCPIAVVSVGKLGCWVGTKEGIFHSSAMNVKAIDTTGAGDLFAAGFLHGYLKGYALEDCAWLGNLLGGTVVSVLGAEIPADKWVEIKQKIDEHFSN